MKKKTITISIPEPCHENWDQMTPSEKGKFCGVCTKEVIDFSKASDEELIKKVGNGANLCGRFKTSQLDRTLTLERKSSNSLLPYAASLLLPLSLLGGPSATAQGGPRVNDVEYTSLGIGSHPLKSIVTITGFITDQNNVPINNAEVFVLETGKSVRTKPDGSYRLVCTSGSTIFSTKGEQESEYIVLGTKNAEIDLKLMKEVLINQVYKNNMVSMAVGGFIAEQNQIEQPNKTNEIIQEETIEGEIEVEEIPELENETKQDNSIAAILNNSMPICGLETDFIEIKGPDKIEVDSVGIVISGTITDENKLPLPGVNVIIKGTRIGTQTDFDGNYSIQPEANQTLVFSYLGYVTQETAVSTISNTIGIQMEPSIEGFISVVVGGYSAREVVTSDEPEVNNPFGYQFPRNDHERNERAEKRRKARANEVAFQKIKLAKRKAARLLKRKRK